jgi:hypothetical protein
VHGEGDARETPRAEPGFPLAHVKNKALFFKKV